jgi:hypothetical protein
VNWKTTLVLLVIVAGLGIWVSTGEKEAQNTTPQGNTYILPGTKPDDVTKVTIARGGKGTPEEIVLVKDGATWMMTKPVADKADGGKVRELVGTLEFLESKETLEGDKVEKATKSFGEVEARLTIVRPKDKGGDATIEIGASSPGEARFCRVVGRPAVYLIPQQLMDRLSWDLFELRSKELFTVDAHDVARLAAKTPATEAGPDAPPHLLELVKGKDLKWRLGGADGELADAKKVTDLVEKVQKLKPTGIQSNAPTPEELAKLGLDKPLVEITLLPAASEGKDLPKGETISIGSADGASETRYARFSGRTTVYKLDAGDVIRELKKDPATLRSDALFPVNAGVEGVTRLTATWKSGRKVDLKKADSDWTIESPGKAKCDGPAVSALVKQVSELKVAGREPAEAAQHLENYGLSEPGLVVVLAEGDPTLTLRVGNAVPSQEGTFYVRRGDEARVFTAKLDDLPKKLDEAPLATRSKVIFKANNYDAVAWKLTAADGTVEAEATDLAKKREWTFPGVPAKNVDGEKVKHLLECFDRDNKGTGAGLLADALVAEVTSASVVSYGLEPARKLSVTVEPYSPDEGAKKKEEKVLLIGRRDGDFVYCMEQNGTAIAKVKTEFLDLIARGFKKGKDVFSYAAPDVTAVLVKEGDKQLLKLDRTGTGVTEEWTLDGKKLVNEDVRERLVRNFDKLEGAPFEEATAASTKEHGLTTPTRTIAFTTKAAYGDKAGETVTKTLVLGNKEGLHGVWAMEAGGTDCGVIYDAPLKKLDEFIASPPLAPTPPPAPVPPAPTVPGDGAPVTSPGK